jgi:hypothetical protein
MNPLDLSYTQLAYAVAILAILCAVCIVIAAPKIARRRRHRQFQKRPPADLRRMCICTFGNDGEAKPNCPQCHGTGSRPTYQEWLASQPPEEESDMERARR